MFRRVVHRSVTERWSVTYNSATPIDKLAEDVKIGARLIKEFDTKLKQVETEVRDAFEELDDKENPFQDKWPIVFHIEIKPIEFMPTSYK